LRLIYLKTLVSLYFFLLKCDMRLRGHTKQFFLLIHFSSEMGSENAKLLKKCSAPNCNVSNDLFSQSFQSCCISLHKKSRWTNTINVLERSKCFQLSFFIIFLDINFHLIVFLFQRTIFSYKISLKVHVL